MTERQLRRLKAQALEDRSVRFDGEDDFLVSQGLPAYCCQDGKAQGEGCSEGDPTAGEGRRNANSLPAR
ncbi:hypothetical protein [Streptomyces sp. AC555_RSS877]|uniref:hypothetical protein n=1 Tax=Streptomyces sp. AC555_RSS877 TaxID=2823688 RepID=UPI001C26EDD2|nr:hypothetical protein [Streptomyces sp. AC555_RSS877]